MRNLEDLLNQKRKPQKSKDLDEKTIFFVFLKVIQELYGTRGEESLRPLRVQDKKIYVRPESSLWANEIFLQKEKLLKNTNLLLEGEYLEDIILTNESVLLSNGLSFDCSTRSLKEKSFMEIRKIILDLPSDNFNDRLLQLLSNYHTSPEIYNSRLMMNWQQIVEISKSAIGTIGVHTVSHRRMSALTAEEIIAELNESRKTIEEKIEKKAVHFAYPFGTEYEIDNNAIDIVRKTDFQTAILANGGLIRKYDKDLYKLKRLFFADGPQNPFRK